MQLRSSVNLYFCPSHLLFHRDSQQHVHAQTCSNVKVQKGAVKCYPENPIFVNSLLFKKNVDSHFTLDLLFQLLINLLFWAILLLHLAVLKMPVCFVHVKKCKDHSFNSKHSTECDFVFCVRPDQHAISPTFFLEMLRFFLEAYS